MKNFVIVCLVLLSTLASAQVMLGTLNYSDQTVKDFETWQAKPFAVTQMFVGFRNNVQRMTRYLGTCYGSGMLAMCQLLRGRQMP